MVFPMGSSSPNRAFAVEADNMMELISRSPSLSPLRIFRSNIWGASRCIKFPILEMLVSPYFRYWGLDQEAITKYLKWSIYPSLRAPSKGLGIAGPVPVSPLKVWD